MDKWIKFYAPYFDKSEDLNGFVESCEALNGQVDAAKIMMHQVPRLVNIADMMEEQYKGTTPLSLLWLIICAENIAKLHDEYHEESKSKYYVKMFFNTFLSDQDKATIQNNITRHLKSLPLDECVNIFYAVRCDVVHEGKYWEFHFRFNDYGIINDPDVVVNLTYPMFRDIVVRGGINATTSKLQNP